jgi:hypothetical protein
MWPAPQFAAWACSGSCVIFPQDLLLIPHERRQQIRDDPAQAGFDLHRHRHAGREVDELVLNLHLCWSSDTRARDDNIRTTAKSDMSSDEWPRAASSFPGETVAMVQPVGSSAQDPPSRTAVDPEQIKLLMKQGGQFIAAGDFVTARIAFQRAAEAGDANAAVAVGATYDPTALAKLGAVGISADVANARGEKLGSPDARRRLEVLADR